MALWRLVALFLFFFFFSCNSYLQHQDLGKPVRWARLPIEITSTLGKEYCSSVSEALSAWNLPRVSVFKLVDSTAPITISFSLDICRPAPAGHYLAETTWSIYNDVPLFQSIRIDICPSVPKESFSLVLIHELGHALGLSHVTWRASVMKPYFHFATSRPTKTDLRVLQNLYKEY